jgi:hypothetical protein
MNYSTIYQGSGMEITGPLMGKIPMHPDDYAALMAWITAKRFHETSLKESQKQIPDFSWRVG